MTEVKVLKVEDVGQTDVPGKTRLGKKIVFEDGSTLVIYAQVNNPPPEELTSQDRQWHKVNPDGTTEEKISFTGAGKDNGEGEARELFFETDAHLLLWELCEHLSKDCDTDIVTGDKKQ